ncbi:hypothetical protein PoB_001620200 [Plakobranchus ocellatus]|uniref:Uncharacterized protein n=1 Tax=Plakobranchus ocellatus TaxID=259542 RepID=A0AAV3Z543_9GAST|nr:hypothetical protein PoB_001620200 [Plakobranchus ocellatus]
MGSNSKPDRGVPAELMAISLADALPTPPYVRKKNSNRWQSYGMLVNCQGKLTRNPICKRLEPSNNAFSVGPMLGTSIREPGIGPGCFWHTALRVSLPLLPRRLYLRQVLTDLATHWARTGIRTSDLSLGSQLLYQVSRRSSLTRRSKKA